MIFFKQNKLIKIEKKIKIFFFDICNRDLKTKIKHRIKKSIITNYEILNNLDMRNDIVPLQYIRIIL